MKTAIGNAFVEAPLIGLDEINQPLMGKQKILIPQSRVATGAIKLIGL